jgi:hypothetical protein
LRVAQSEAVSTALRRFDPIARWRYPILLVAAATFSAQQYRAGGHDWHFFLDGSRLLFGQHSPTLRSPGGLRIYANYRGLQIGPLTFLVATPFRLLRSAGRPAAAAAMTALVPGLIYLLERVARALQPADVTVQRLTRWTVLLGGLLVVQAWSSLSTQYAHLDDALVLTFFCVALLAVVHARPVLVGVALGLAMAAKPWGFIALPLAFVVPREVRWRLLMVASVIAGIAWLPFVLADRHTLGALEPHLATSTRSVLHLFGVGEDDHPLWVRPVQLVTSVCAGSIAVRRRRWGAVLAVGIAVRLLLDPGVFLYYSAGMLLMALAWDLVRSRWPLPLCTVASFWLLAVARESVVPDTVQAILRLLVTLGLLAYVALSPGSDVLLPVVGRPPTRNGPGEAPGPLFRSEAD